MTMWIVASLLFFLYVSTSSYSATYGAFAGVVILLVGSGSRTSYCCSAPS